MAEQIHGLASALNILHEFYAHRAEDDDDPRNHGIHGDIKPENILRFTNWDGDPGKHGVLQLADFGLTKYHHTATVNHVDPHMRFHPYCAPEVQANWRTNQSLDTWALGCLFFEFCLWVVFGNEGLRGFDESRTVVNSDGSMTVGMLYEIHGYGTSGCWPFPRVNKKITIHEGVVQVGYHIYRIDSNTDSL
jgi:serine/threonine protein kinase